MLTRKGARQVEGRAPLEPLSVLSSHWGARPPVVAEITRMQEAGPPSHAGVGGEKDVYLTRVSQPPSFGPGRNVASRQPIQGQER